MRYDLSEEFTEKFESLPNNVRLKFWKQLRFLLQDIQYPSLRAKKYIESRDIWQARVDRNYRFYFLIDKDTYILLDIRSHPK